MLGEGGVAKAVVETLREKQDPPGQLVVQRVADRGGRRLEVAVVEGHPAADGEQVDGLVRAGDIAGQAADIVKLAEAVRQPEFHHGIRFIAFGFAKIGIAPEGNPRVALLVIEPRPGTTQRAVDGGPLVPRIQRFDRRIPVPWTAADPPIFITGLPAEIGAVGDQTCGESVSTPEQIGMEHGEPTSNSRLPTEVSSHLSTESPIRKQAEGLRLST